MSAEYRIIYRSGQRGKPRSWVDLLRYITRMRCGGYIERIDHIEHARCPH